MIVLIAGVIYLLGALLETYWLKGGKYFQTGKILQIEKHRILRGSFRKISTQKQILNEIMFSKIQDKIFFFDPGNSWLGPRRIFPSIKGHIEINGRDLIVTYRRLFGANWAFAFPVAVCLQLWIREKESLLTCLLVGMVIFGITSLMVAVSRDKGISRVKQGLYQFLDSNGMKIK